MKILAQKLYEGFQIDNHPSIETDRRSDIEDMETLPLLQYAVALNSNVMLEIWFN